MMTKRWLLFAVQGFALAVLVGLVLGRPSPARAGLVADGAGTMDVAGGPVVASSAGNTLTFTYTADSSGVTDGTVEIAVPDGWTAPQTGDGSAPGFVSGAPGLTASTGNDGTGGTITLSEPLLVAGGQVTITYSNATPPPTGGSATFTSSEGDLGDSAVPLASSPSVQILAPDGSGTMVVAPGSVPAGSTQSLTFSYAADPGGIQSGTVDLAVPSGWTTPQTTDPTSAGYVADTLGTSDSGLDQVGTISVQPSGIVQMTGVTLAGGDTLLVSYGEVTAPSAASYTFTTDESSAGGPPVNLVTQPQVTVTPVTAPGTPSLVSATPGDGSVQLSWSAPTDDGGASVTDYLINEYQGSDTSGTPTTIDTGSPNTSATVPNLADGQEYTFTVEAVDSVGPGSASSSLSATPATVPGAPSLTSATPENGTVDLSWSPPTDNGGASVNDYVIYEYTGGDTSGTATAIDTQSTSTSAAVTGLMNGQRYTFTVAAGNSAGDGASSKALSATPVSAPGSPSLNSAEPGNGQVQLSWSPPSDDGGSSVTDYVIYEYQGGDTSGTATSADTHSSSTSATVSGLTNGQQYTFTVVAVNSVGPGAPSSSLSATPTATAPGAPALQSATGGNGQVQLSWSPPSDDGGSSVTDYVIKEYPGGDTSGSATSIDTGSSATSAAVKGLTNGQEYTFTVEAVNSVGPGPASGSLSATPAATAPGAPTLQSATGGNGTVQLSWSAPSDDGGSSVTDYVIEEYQGGDASGTPVPIDTQSTGTSFKVSGLTNGQPYTFTVEAANSVGPGPASGSLSATPAPVAPGAPTLLSATGGNGQVQLSWSKPAQDGGASVGDYVIEQYTGGDTSGTATPIDTGSSATSATVKGLTNGGEYTFTVEAVNSAGPGDASSPQSATPATVPGVPSLTSATPGDGDVDLAWSPPTNAGGASVNDYVIYEYQGGDTSGTPTSIDTHSTATSTTVTGLTNGQQYSFTVEAVNPEGTGAPSSSLSAAPRTVPDAPTLTAAPGPGKISLAWTTPANGGAVIDHYAISEYVGSSATGTPTTIDTTSTSQTVSGLTNGTTYTFEVAAVNVAGSSGPSNIETGTPATVPTAPKMLATVAGPSIVEVVWGPPAGDGGSPIGAYDIFRSTTAGAEGTQIASQTPTSSTNTYIDQSVANGTTYYYEVVAVNRAGQSPASEQFSAEPKRSLPPPLLVKTITLDAHKVTFSSPNKCVPAGRVPGTLTISSLKPRSPKVVIGKAVFKLGKLASKTITRRKPSSAPIHVTLHVKRMLAKHTYGFLAEPSIAVGKGSPHRHSLRLKITAC